MILQRQLDQRLIHQKDVASPAHSKMQERDQEIPDVPGLNPFVQASWIVQRHSLAKIRFAQFHEIGMIVGDFREIGTLKNEVDAIYLRGQKHGFRIIVRDYYPWPREQMGNIDPAPDVFRNLVVALEEVRDRAIHKLETDFQRWRRVDLRPWLGAQQRVHIVIFSSFLQFGYCWVILYISRAKGFGFG